MKIETIAKLCPKKFSHHPVMQIPSKNMLHEIRRNISSPEIVAPLCESSFSWFHSEVILIYELSFSNCKIP